MQKEMKSHRSMPRIQSIKTVSQDNYELLSKGNKDIRELLINMTK